MAHWRSWFVGVIIIAALVGAVLHWGELRNFAELLRRAEPGWLILLGLGSFEVVCTSTLHLLGVPLEPALAGTLLLRVLILWLPLVPGLVLMRRMMGRRGGQPRG